MSRKSKSGKIVIDGDKPRGPVDALAQARTASGANEDRRAMIEAAVKDIMSKNVTLLKKLAE